MRRKDFRVEVPMNFYHFQQKGPQVFKAKKRPSGAVDAGAEAQPSKVVRKDEYEGERKREDKR